MDNTMTDYERYIVSQLKGLNRMELDEVLGGLYRDGKI